LNGGDAILLLKRMVGFGNSTPEYFQVSGEIEIQQTLMRKQQGGIYRFIGKIFSF
jgi:hypothetical protein